MGRPPAPETPVFSPQPKNPADGKNYKTLWWYQFLTYPYSWFFTKHKKQPFWITLTRKNLKNLSNSLVKMDVRWSLTYRYRTSFKIKKNFVEPAYALLWEDIPFHKYLLVSIISLTHWHQDFVVQPLRFIKKDTVQYYLNAFYTKSGLSQGLLPEMELHKKGFLQY